MHHLNYILRSFLIQTQKHSWLIKSSIRNIPFSNLFQSADYLRRLYSNLPQLGLKNYHNTLFSICVLTQKLVTYILIIGDTHIFSQFCVFHWFFTFIIQRSSHRGNTNISNFCMPFVYKVRELSKHLPSNG